MERCKLCGAEKIKTIINSNLANVDEIKKYQPSTPFSAPSYSIVKCKNCGLVFLLSNKTQKELTSLYSKIKDENYLSEEKNIRRMAQRIIKKINKFVPIGSKLLDIGCFTGLFLDEARRFGYKVLGIEPSIWGANYAKDRLNLPVICCGFEEVELNDKFDVIVMQEVIEHFVDVKSVLLKVYNMLNSNGIVYISTPNIDSLLAKFFGRNWPIFRDAHYYYFSHKTISRLLTSIGFKIKSVDFYRREFTLKYLCDKLNGYNNFLYKIMSNFIRICGISHFSLKTRAFDEIELIAKK